MTLDPQDKDRRIIPRWRQSVVTARLGELDGPASAAPIPQLEMHYFEEALRAWVHEPTLENAGDLISAALVVGRSSSEVSDAAHFVASHDSVARSAASLARLVLDGATGVEVKQTTDDTTLLSRLRIASMRRVLADYPNDPLQWTDLAREYVIAGQKRPAIRAIERALASGGENRFVLRSATRLFLHLGQPDRALDILHRSVTTRSDPWLLAAQIATSQVAGRPPEFIAGSRRLLKSSKFGALALSELASAVGSLEFAAGDSKTAKKLIRQSLEDPTENAVAQAGWMARRLNGLEVTAQAMAVPRSFEAGAWRAYMEARWEASAQECAQWLDDEPFSKRPAEFGSFLAATAIRDFEQCITFANRGLIANPGDAGLTNNLVVALAKLGRMEEARSQFESIERPAAEAGTEITLVATAGLLEFRSGRVDAGRALYLEAIEAARAAGKRQPAAMAFLHLAEEELKVRSPMASETLRLAEVACVGFSDTSLVAAYLNRLKQIHAVNAIR